MCENYSFEEIEKPVKDALDKLHYNDKYLLEHDVNEQSITHRLAMYLEDAFFNYNVDCEYNRYGDDSKRLIGKSYKKYKKDFKCEIDKFKNEIDSDKIVKPDIIVHKRGGNDHNLLAIELKKSNNKDENYNRLKLMIFTDKDYGLSYKYGLFIKLDKEKELNKLYKLCWFSDGKCISL
ncbi:hypothetical protein [Thermoanaerobacterium thermosaccharolyticum]|uniref:hypothetical protein n=1 Tax=Thermoanaerobacterium thermosaccharolyticum TaxID=1517 RepID=UPI0020A3EB36|nr:hypothetical protein [Thermoanaerobacterium thermosaccharolyticum]MCP2241260.1 hypothetical protein [Thermoanaerobacterium thermosaccharolyticum]